MKKVIPFLILIFVINHSFAQRFRTRDFQQRDFEYASDKFIYSLWINPVQYEENFILNYQIRYDYVLFEKTLTDTFQARLKVILELSSNELVSPIRQIEEIVINCSEFEQTISRDLFYQGSFAIKLEPNSYKAALTLIDQVRNKEFFLKPFEVNLKDPKNFVPIFINVNQISELLNKDLKNSFYNFLPFGSEKYALILPDSEDFEKIKISNSDVSYELKRLQNSGFKYSIFILDTLDLVEGEYNLSSLTDKKISKSFKVRWMTKPDYLKDFENAVKIAKYIFDEDTVNTLLRINSDKRVREFFKLWKRFDPTPETPYNELMTEFYKRADVASIQFKSVSQPDGALTDRGKIYIIYGPPYSVHRTFKDDGRAIELWTYNSNPELQFTFFDENKNGNYILQQ